MLSVIVPAHNEAQRIKPALEKLLSFLKRRGGSYEVVVVDDGSDGTAEIVSAFAAKNSRVKLMHFPRRLGKGLAVKKGMLAAQGDALLYDADGSTPPTEIPKLLRELKRFDLVIGSRALPASKIETNFFRRFLGRSFHLLVKTLFGLKVSDTQCGFKLVKKRFVKPLAKELKHSGLEFDVELLALARNRGMKIKEVAIEWHHVPGGPVQKSNVLFTAAEMLYGILRLRLEL